MANSEERMGEEAVLMRYGKIGSDKWGYNFSHYNPNWRGNTTDWSSRAEKLDGHYVLSSRTSDDRSAGSRENFGVEEATPEGILNADRRIREVVLQFRKHFPNAPLVKRVDENDTFRKLD